VNESLASNDPGTQKRRSTRIVQAVPITVTGVDALGQPFKERTTTVMVNCHGCKYQSKHYVPKNSVVTLDIPRLEPGGQPRMVLGTSSGCSARGPFANCFKLDWNSTSPEMSGGSRSRLTTGIRSLVKVLPPRPHRRTRPKLPLRRLPPRRSNHLRRRLCQRPYLKIRRRLPK
jgi:hypothetical protein